MPRFFTRPGIAWGLYLCWAAAIWVGSSLQLGADSPLQLTFPDKLGHALEFGILGLLGANALLTRERLSATKKAGAEAARGLKTGRGIWFQAVMLAFLWGVIDEVHQLFVPGRQSDPLDAAADLIGAACGAWLLIRFSVARSESAPEPEWKSDGE